jgi:hypothetical protein
VAYLPAAAKNRSPREVGTFGSGNAGDGNVRRAAAGLKRACPPKLQRRKGPGRQTPRWSAERRACVSRSKRNVRAAPHPRGSLAPQGATTTTRCASRRSAHPSIRWVKVKLTRARPRAGTRRRGLFDIVRWDDTATVRRRAASSVAVIVPSPTRTRACPSSALQVGRSRINPTSAGRGRLGAANKQKG